MAPPSWTAVNECLLPMKVLSINVGRPRLVLDRGREVSTGIFKSPVFGPVMLRQTNFDGDRQADLNAHGGINKALYAYPYEHYAFWRNELGGLELLWGNFGENLTTEGLHRRPLSRRRRDRESKPAANSLLQAGHSLRP
jgi:MOSC domain-containing protein YiiM